jgi:hypothetical protein
LGRGPNFIEREVFDAVMVSVPRVDGAEYQDLDTIYGDMSRLVVAFLARTPPEELRVLYNELGWKRSATVRAMHAAARSWLDQYHPGRCSVVEETADHSVEPARSGASVSEAG